MGKYFDETISKFIICGETYQSLHNATISIRKLQAKDGILYELVLYTSDGRTDYPGELSKTPQEAFKSMTIVDMLDTEQP